MTSQQRKQYKRLKKKEEKLNFETNWFVGFEKPDHKIRCSNCIYCQYDRKDAGYKLTKMQCRKKPGDFEKFSMNFHARRYSRNAQFCEFFKEKKEKTEQKKSVDATPELKLLYSLYYNIF